MNQVPEQLINDVLYYVSEYNTATISCKVMVKYGNSIIFADMVENIIN
jgi:hypothetical protein